MTSIFNLNSEEWNTQSLFFEHHLGGCCTNNKIAEVPVSQITAAPTHKHISAAPADKEADFTNWAYGQMPHTLTLRPILHRHGCCACRTERHFAVARDMFGATKADVMILYPCMDGCFNAGCQDADVLFTSRTYDALLALRAKENSAEEEEKGTADQIKGKFGFNMCPGFIKFEQILKWDHEATKNPEMVWRRLGGCDMTLYGFCCTVWTGWRGRTDAEKDAATDEKEEYTYDQSYLLNQCDQIRLNFRNCMRTGNDFCSVKDVSWRFGRPEDIRRLLLERYDWEMCLRDIKKNEDLVEYSLREGAIRVLYPLPRAHEVDALYSARLYHDVTCSVPKVRFDNNQGEAEGTTIPNYDKAGCDVRYRGSRNHGAPTLADHLVVLAGLILNAAATFPYTKADDGLCQNACAYAANIGPVGNVRSGRILPMKEKANLFPELTKA